MNSSSEAPARARVRHGHEVTASPHELPELRTFAATFDVRRVGIPDALLDEVLEAARIEGYEAGRAEALVAAERELRDRRETQQATIDQALATLDTAAERLIEHQDVLDARLVGQVTEIAFGIAEALVGHDLATATDPGRDAIARALAVAPSRASVVVRLHPDDIAVVNQSPEPANGRHISFVDDPTLARGDAAVELDAGEIDATMGAALERVRRTLGGHT